MGVKGADSDTGFHWFNTSTTVVTAVLVKPKTRPRSTQTRTRTTWMSTKTNVNPDLDWYQGQTFKKIKTKIKTKPWPTWTQKSQDHLRQSNQTVTNTRSRQDLPNSIQLRRCSLLSLTPPNLVISGVTPSLVTKTETNTTPCRIQTQNHEGESRPTQRPTKT